MVSAGSAWTPCPCCENFLCLIHGGHAHDCPCPPLEEWTTNPYTDRPMTVAKLPRSLERYAHMISDVSDERDTDDGYWVHLRPGWWHPDDETHCVHRDNLRECSQEMKSVEQCRRDCCK